MIERRWRRRRALIGALTAGVLLSAAPASAGWVIDQVVKGGSDKERSRQRVFLQANRLKVIVGDGVKQSQATIMNLDTQTIVHVDYPARTYTTATVAEYAELLGQASRASAEALRQMPQMKDIEQQLQSLPPDQRRAIEAMMRQNQPAMRAPAGPSADCARDSVEVRALGRKITVAGYEASGYQIVTSGKRDSEIYVAPAITAAKEIDPEKLERMVATLLKAMPQCPPRGQVFGDPSWKLMKEGYPVRSLGLESGVMTEVVKAEQRMLNVDEFEPPAGFASSTLKEMMGGR